VKDMQINVTGDGIGAVHADGIELDAKTERFEVGALEARSHLSLNKIYR